MRVLLALAAATALVAQDESGVIELKVKVGKRPTSGTGISGFQFELKDPVNVTGKPAKAEALRAALDKALQYVLGQQDEKDGSWSIKDSQLSDLGKKSGFRNTARDSASKPVVTALACMALRWHEELMPEKIKAAVSRGLDYVIENAPKHSKDRYGIWNWAFCIEFLVDEYHRAKSADLKSRIKEAVQQTAERLLKNQHKGIRAVKETPRPDPEREVPKYVDELAKRRESGKQAATGGYLGITPAQEGDEDEGLIVQAVAPGGPAAKGGLKNGDRILEIAGKKINSTDQLLETARALKPGEEIVIKVVREDPKKEREFPALEPQDKPPQDKPPQDRPPQRPPQRRPAQIPEDGGWSYYSMGAMSFATATAVIALMDARDIGCDIPKDAIERGIANVLSQRLTTKGSEDGFGYRGGATRGPSGDLRASVGRICVCELALLKAGKSDLKYLERAVKIFVNMRQELDLVLGYPGNHVRHSFANAAYYFMYAHYYSARTLHSLKEADKRARYGAYIQEALLKHQMQDGTWHDHESWGRLYGTSMALMALGQLKMVTPDAYARTLPTGGGDY
jgi:hypothetical protein